MSPLLSLLTMSKKLDKRFGEFVARHIPEGESGGAEDGYFFGGYLYRGHIIEWDPQEFGYRAEGLGGRFKNLVSCIKEIDRDLDSF